MHTFEVKPVGNGWYYRCETRGVSAHDPIKGWTRDEALKHAARKAQQQPPAEILIYDESGSTVLESYRIGASGLHGSVKPSDAGGRK